MKSTIFTSAVISAFLLTTAITTQAGDSSKSSAANPHSDSDSTAQTPMKSGKSDSHGMEDHSKMKGSSMHNMPMSGDPDKDFAMMMKMHHQQGLEMAEMELQQGKSAEMKAMAKKIMEAQKKEIAQLDKWLGKQQQ